MKVLLLGGTGAMGVALAPILINQGYDVYITTRSNRVSNNEHLIYVQGDAHNTTFLKETLRNSFDAVVDFMSYTSNEFQSRVELLLNNTKQYIFLSSSRVYNSTPIITEKSPRLLDSINDNDYLKTDEYALAKAREEDLLLKSDRQNWTIIRPYVTYNDNRLQLTILEKDMWLDRAFRGKKILYFDQFSNHEATMTHGHDVAKLMSFIICNSNAYGQIYHVTTDEHHSWKYIFKEYCRDIEEVTGNKPRVVISHSDKDLSNFGRISGRTWQIKYDRLFDRIFDNSKITEQANSDFSFIPMKQGFKTCIGNYYEQCKQDESACQILDYKIEGFLDRLTREKEPLSSIAGTKDRIKYFAFRYLPVSFCERLADYLANRRKR